MATILQAAPSRPSSLFTTILLSSSLLLASHHVSASTLPPAPSCKSIPGSPSWPAPDLWSQLNATTGGRLIAPAPPGAVCHPGQPTYDEARCAAVQAGWSWYDLHQDDPVSSMWNQFNNDTCLPDPRAPCSGAGYPVFVVNATEAKHVKLAVDFARTHNIRLVVKSSGHDYIGRSSAPNSLSIWTHHMKDLKIHEGSFKPRCCGVKIEGTAVTVGAGSQMRDVYAFTDRIGRAIVGGGGETVSVGGYLSGGGHSLLSAKYGMAADQVLQMQVVTAAGEILTINECTHPDLFWAMRGGGGSTFAVLTSVTLATHPTPKILALDFALAAPANSTAATHNWAVLAYVLSQFPALGDAGLTGYTFLFNQFRSPIDGTLVSGMAGNLALLDPQNGLNDTASFLALFAPIVAHIQTTWPGYLFLPKVRPYESFAAWFADYRDKTPTGFNMYVASRLLGKKELEGDQQKLAGALERFTAFGVSTAYLVSGKGVADAKPRGGGNAVGTAWRKAYVHATCGVDFPPLNATAREEAFGKMDYILEGLRSLAPDMGVYMNEGNPREPDWQHQFWGANYERLHAIKRAVDPNDVFWCNPCVGNERWAEKGDVLCRV